MGAFDISYNDIAGAPLGSGKKKVAPIQAAQGIAAPTAALSSPQMIDAQPSIIQAPAVQQLVPAQSITQGADGYMRAHQPGDAVSISYPPIIPNATTAPSPVPSMPMPPGIAKAMAGGGNQQPAPATIADIRRPPMQAQPMRAEQTVQAEAEPTGHMISREVKDGLANGAAQAFSSTLGAIQKSGDAAQRAAGDGNYGGAIGHVIRGAAGGIAGFGDDVIRSAAKVLDPAANALKTLVTGDDTPINQAASQSAAVKTIADVVRPGGQQSYRPGSATANALNETGAYPQSRPGDQMAPASAPQKPGRNADGVITAESVASHSGDLKPGQMRIGDGGFNLADQNEKMARALGYNGTDDFNRQFRLRNDPEAQRIDSMVNNKGSVSAIDDQIKVNQAESGRVANENARQLQVLQQKGIAGDTKAIETLRALSGKPNQATDRFMAVQGGEEIGPDGMTKIKRPGGVFDAQTGRFVEMSPQQGGPGKFSKADVESALAKGADKAKIAERIKSMGGNPADYGL